MFKTKEQILQKLGIKKLNPMQEESLFAIKNLDNIILISPTGTGKTLAFLLPIIEELNTTCNQIQALILVPSRELAIQIERVTRDMGAGFKVNAVYGGRAGNKDKIEFKNPPAILIGTPGRIADHLRRENINVKDIKTLVLDEFDKSLEVGFETDMEDIIKALPNIKKKILTSATQRIRIPKFVKLFNPTTIDYSKEKIKKLVVKRVISPTKDKLDTLVDLLSHIGNQTGIVFCNFKDTIRFVSDFLIENGINHGIYHGGMEQIERERALVKFRNGTNQLLLATDLAARGIDIPELKFIIHYQLPPREQEFTHRNGRTARMKSDGTAYVLQWKNEKLADFLAKSEEIEMQAGPIPYPSLWKTVFISGGRKDKISKGDIAGLFFKQGGLTKDEFGVIELKKDCAFVAVLATKVDVLIKTTNNTRLKKKKVRISLI